MPSRILLEITADDLIKARAIAQKLIRENPEVRPFAGVTIGDLVRWQNHRDSLGKSNALDGPHNLVHVIKALGPLATKVDHDFHGEQFSFVDSKRPADLIVHSTWLARCCGFDPEKVVRERILSFEDGFSLEGEI